MPTSPCLEIPRPHFSAPDDVMTINYILDWPHLENPSNTTFAGVTQLDICHCPRPDLPRQDDTEPGHLYTRFACAGPDVRFKTEQQDLWVLEAPRGPINMLRPATAQEQARRRAVHADAHAAAYQAPTLIFLTGPCPRGRYQAYATQRWLQDLRPDARHSVSRLCLLVQPYEEDCSDDATRLAYADLAAYLAQHVPALRTLYLHICPEGAGLCHAASAFSILLRGGNTAVVVVHHAWTGQTTEYTDSAAFLDAMMAMARREGLPRASAQSVRGDGAAGRHYAVEAAEPSAREKGQEGEDDGDWTDGAMSPTSPSNETDRDWQLL